MAFGAYDKKSNLGRGRQGVGHQLSGKFCGLPDSGLIFVGAGAAGTKEYFAGYINNKLTIPMGEMFFRAVLCNFFVCLAVLCGIKLKEETAKILMIMICISGFVISGFEHCVANMGIFVTAFAMDTSLSIGAMLRNLAVVTLGNMVGAAVLLAWPLRKMSADK